MSKIISCLLTLSYFVLVLSVGSNTESPDKNFLNFKIATPDILLQPYFELESKAPLFNAWHFIFNKEYKLNTFEGLHRYRIFQENLKKIEEHNNNNLSWKMGINHLSDMTDEEVTEYYNLKPISDSQIVKNLRNMGADFESLSIDTELSERPIIDHRDIMRPIRNQNQCGSCWAFATQATLEGSYQKWEKTILDDHFSTQESIDCDEFNSGCSGGWFSQSFKFFESKSLVYEKSYPYKAIKGKCQYKPGMIGDTNIKSTGFNAYYDILPDKQLNEMIRKGPVAACVNAGTDWYKYKSGIYDAVCEPSCNHAIVIVGYNCEGQNCYFIIRNSWGSTWGEQGHIRIKDYPKKERSSCNIEKFGFTPKGFTKN